MIARINYPLQKVDDLPATLSFSSHIIIDNMKFKERIKQKQDEQKTNKQDSKFKRRLKQKLEEREQENGEKEYYYNRD